MENGAEVNSVKKKMNMQSQPALPPPQLPESVNPGGPGWQPQRGLAAQGSAGRRPAEPSPAGKATVQLSVVSTPGGRGGPQGVAEKGTGREGCTVPSPSFLAEPCSSAGPAAPHLEEHLDPRSSEETFAHSGVGGRIQVALLHSSSGDAGARGPRRRARWRVTCQAGSGTGAAGSMRWRGEHGGVWQKSV